MSRNHVTYRLLTKDCLTDCADVILKAFRPVSDRFGIQETAGAAQLTLQLQESLDKGERLYGCFLEERQIGCFLLSEQEQGVFEISKLCVLPAWQGQGYGSTILDTALETIRVMGGVGAVCAIIYEYDLLRTWLLRRGFFETFTGMLSGMSCSICLMQKELPLGGCENGCESCGGQNVL